MVRFTRNPTGLFSKEDDAKPNRLNHPRDLVERALQIIEEKRQTKLVQNQNVLNISKIVIL